jgi:ACS family D-galactonate transporter-like MFS transporter
LFKRELTDYPTSGRRFGYLGLTVLVTIALYYMAYCGGSVSTLQLVDMNMSFHFLIWVAAIGNVLGAFGALFAGVTDRLGRVPVILVGLSVVSLVTLFVLPATHDRYVFAVLTFIAGNIEGIVLVATPALIRDFSPQTGRATAMGAWTLGPVIGSLVVSVVGTITVHGTPTPRFWGHEYVIAGIAGLVVSALAIAFLKELAPQLRDQLMVSEKDRVLAQMKAKGLDVEQALRNPFKQMLKKDVIISGFAVSILLLAYYTTIALGSIFMQVVFSFNLQQANSLGNWTWGASAVTAIVVGVASDRLKVRKPFMIAGSVITAVAIAMYLSHFGHHTSYAMVAFLVSAIAVGLGIAYTPWMASFSETCEDHNPALTATGLAIWGLTIRVVIFFMLIVLPMVITTVTPLVNFVVKTSGYTNAIVWAGDTPGFEVPANQAQLLELGKLQSAHPAEMAAITKGSADLATLAAYPTVTAAVSAHPTVFQAFLTTPTAANRAAAVAASGEAVVATLVAHEGQLIPAFLWAQANQSAVALAVQNSSTLTWAATHQALISAVQANLPYVQQLATLETSTKPSETAIRNYVAANTTSVLRAEAQVPGQAKTWYWICFGGALAFLGGVPLLKGRWSPRRARTDFDAHEAAVQAELTKLGVTA